MAAKPHNVRLLQCFFTETRVQALPTHDASGVRTGTTTSLSTQFEEVSADPLRHAVTVAVETDDEASENAPYSFKIVAVGFFGLESTDAAELVEAYLVNHEVVAIQILMGAIREHLASITSRGPWTTFMMGLTQVIRQDKEPIPEE